MLSCGFIFDMDGVLVETGAFHMQAFDRLTLELKVPHDPAFFKAHFGMTNAMILPDLLRRALTDDEIQHWADYKEELFRDLIRGQVKPLAGLADFMQAAQNAGVLLGVGSSGPEENVSTLLSELGWRDRMAGVVTGDDVRQGKPDPEVFLLAAQRMGVPPDRCVVFEDAPVGLRAARAAGMHAIGLSTTHSATELDGLTDLVAPDFTTLTVPDLLKKFRLD